MYQKYFFRNFMFIVNLEFVVIYVCIYFVKNIDKVINIDNCI